MRTTTFLAGGALLCVLYASCEEEILNPSAVAALGEAERTTYEQMLVAKAQAAVGDAGIDPCEEDVVYLICTTVLTPTERKTESHIITADMTDRHLCRDGWVVCPGPRDCAFTYESIGHILLAGFVYALRPGYGRDTVVEFTGIVTSALQGHCQDDKAVLLECPGAPWENVLLYEDEVIRMKENRFGGGAWSSVPPCPGLTLVCPHGMGCVVATEYRSEVLPSYGTRSLQQFGRGMPDPYRLELNVEDHGGLVAVDVRLVLRRGIL